MARLCDCTSAVPQPIPDVETYVTDTTLPTVARQVLLELQVCGDCGGKVPDRQERVQIALISGIARGSLKVGKASSPPEDESRILSPDRLAGKLGMSRNWVYDNKETLGGFPLGDGDKPRWGFFLDVARARLATQNEKPPSAAHETKRRRPRARSKQGVPMLPIKSKR